jgi:hypothetical protein
MTDLIALRAANADRWAHAKLARGPEFSPVAQRLCSPFAKQHKAALCRRVGAHGKMRRLGQGVSVRQIH